MPLTVISFLIVMSILVFVHELGHYLVAKRSKIVVEEFGFGYPPRVVRLFERGGTIYSINAIPFGGFVKLRGEDDPTLAGSFAAAPKLARAATLLAGATMNFLLAILLFAILALMTGVPDASRPGAVVRLIAAGSPAEQGGLQVNDRIVAADNTPVASYTDLSAFTAANLGRPIVFRVVRAGVSGGADKTLELTMTPRADPPAGQGPLGIQITTAIRPAKIWEAAWEGVRSTGEVIGMTFLMPARLIREGRPLGDAGVMGPVGIAATTGEVVRSSLAADTITPIIWFVGLLSAAVGITNLLPIPGLDGGRLLFVLLEAIRRKRIEPAREGIVHLIGIGMLLLLVGVVTVREVTSLVNGTFPTLGIR